MPASTKLKVLDLFSGIGMFSYGLHKTGLYETSAFCEWDSKCQQVLKKNFPSVFCYTDISYLTYQDGYLYSEKDSTNVFTEVDVIVGGFPCFKGGTLINTEYGLVNIEDIKARCICTKTGLKSGFT